jgi:hypothetical protein
LNLHSQTLNQGSISATYWEKKEKKKKKKKKKKMKMMVMKRKTAFW